MTFYTEETLLITLFRLAKELGQYFSISSDFTFGYFTIWAGPEFYQCETFTDALIWAYRRFEEIAKEKGIEIEEVELQ